MTVIMRNTRRAVFLMLALIVLSVTVLPAGEALAKEKKKKKEDKEDNLTYHIVLDPGHGGIDSGASGFGTNEKKLVLKLAKSLKKELLKYNNVSVEMTRETDKFIKLKKRTTIALEKNADLMISLHLDSYDPNCKYSRGCTAIVSKGTHRPVMSKEETSLAQSILYALDDIGIPNQGLIRRLSDEGKTYRNGKPADYYAVIRNGIIKKLPTILVEHGFIDDGQDYKNHFSSDKKIQKVAEAEALGIARYLRLERKEDGTIPKPIKVKGKKMVVRIKEDSYLKIRSKSYYVSEDRKAQGKKVDPEKEKERIKKEKEEKERKMEEARLARFHERAVTEGTNLVVSLIAMLFCVYGVILANESIDHKRRE